MICPTCRSDNLQRNSIGEELLCKDCGAILALYDKRKYITVALDQA